MIFIVLKPTNYLLLYLRLLDKGRDLSRDCLEKVQHFLAGLGPKTSLSESSDSTSVSRSSIVGVDFEELAPKKERISIVETWLGTVN